MEAKNELLIVSLVVLESICFLVLWSLFECSEVGGRPDATVYPVREAALLVAHRNFAFAFFKHSSIALSCTANILF
jgi:hypothetical protein